MIMLPLSRSGGGKPEWKCVGKKLVKKRGRKKEKQLTFNSKKHIIAVY
jgi:hypothetical protein